MVKVQRLGVSRRAKRPEVPSPSIEGEEIVCSAWKPAAAMNGGHGVAICGEQPERSKSHFQGLKPHHPMLHVSWRIFSGGCAMNCMQCGKELDGKQQKQFCSTSCWYASRAWSREGVCAVCDKAYTKEFRDQICCSRECGNRYKSADRIQKCAACGESFERPHGKTRTYCSRSCAMMGRARAGQIPSHKEGATIRHSSGYIQQKRDGSGSCSTAS